MKDIKLIIFDWDGTLMDSANHIVNCLRGAIKTLGLQHRHDDELKNIIGLGMHEAIFSLYPDQQSTAFADKFTAAYRQTFFADDAPQAMFPGSRKTLEALKPHYQLAVATGKSRHGLDLVLEETGLMSFFHESRCADETQSKPHPQMLNEILGSLDVSADEAIMVGDTEYDLEMANLAGVHPVGVSYGVHEVSRLHKHNPVHMLDKIEELPAWLEMTKVQESNLIPNKEVSNE